MDDSPTEFEIITALAFLHFQRSGCDIVVLEVGMGGRLDATNVIKAPEVAVITAIGLDHATELGNTVQKVAFEKSGIIKKGSDVVLYEQEPSVEGVISQICDERGAKLHKVDLSEMNPLNFDLDGQTAKHISRTKKLPLLSGYWPIRIMTQ